MTHPQAAYILTKLEAAPPGSDRAGVLVSASTDWERMNGSRPILGSVSEIEGGVDEVQPGDLVVRFEDKRDAVPLLGFEVEVRRAP